MAGSKAGSGEYSRLFEPKPNKADGQKDKQIGKDISLQAHGGNDVTPTLTNPQSRSMPKDFVYFDLETQRSANDVGGWNNKADMRMSVGVTYSTRTGKYVIYPEDQHGALIDQLLAADRVIGYNTINFDYEVLMGYTILDLPSQIVSLDLMVEIENASGHRPKLESVAQASIGVGKTGKGIDAIKWWREGKARDVAEYCCYDVKVTKLVHEFGVTNKRIDYMDRNGRRLSTPIEWPAP